eukprot:CAMPEP_0171323056 /NCGR_PEP_ID=MMETSP0816-20121228/115337_1 /TAXON_ID=420281 /ORGANISM="Proboscia inermis, Strain CCAP1064/1" /LENGTH=195 /DNA_ID=CAMNT_0011821667 /DNA_START=479 /DNA_END=1066 /DNA_ORIENTATION=+
MDSDTLVTTLSNTSGGMAIRPKRVVNALSSSPLTYTVSFPRFQNPIPNVDGIPPSSPPASNTSGGMAIRPKRVVNALSSSPLTYTVSFPRFQNPIPNIDGILALEHGRSNSFAIPEINRFHTLKGNHLSVLNSCGQFQQLDLGVVRSHHHQHHGGALDPPHLPDQLLRSENPGETDVFIGIPAWKPLAPSWRRFF